MWIVCITSVRHVLTVNGYGGRQTKENEKSWCFKGWETLVIYTTDLEQKDNIINFLVVTLKLNRIVFETRYLKNIPRSETGKVLYAELPIK